MSHCRWTEWNVCWNMCRWCFYNPWSDIWTLDEESQFLLRERFTSPSLHKPENTVNSYERKNPCSSRQAESDIRVYSPTCRSFSLSGWDDYSDNKRKQSKWTWCAFIGAVIWILEVGLFLPHNTKARHSLKGTASVHSWSVFNSTWNIHNQLTTGRRESRWGVGL